MRGRALVEEKYQWSGIAERMLEFYEWILNFGKKTRFCYLTDFVKKPLIDANQTLIYRIIIV